MFILYITCFNPFSTNTLLLYPLKTSVFRGYRSGKLVENGLNISVASIPNLLNVTLLESSFLRIKAKYRERVALHKKLSFPLRISSVNVIKSLMEIFIFRAVWVE